MDPAGVLKPVLAHVGTVRSEILVFCILAFVLLEGFGLASGHDLIANTLKISGIFFLFLGFAFYIYAFLHLPSTAQERIFTEQAASEIERTRQVVQAARKSKRSVPAPQGAPA
jgi:hypothetical protein